MNMEKAVATLLIATTLVCVLLTCFTVVRKLRRDRHEAVFARRRLWLGQLLVSPDPSALEKGLRQIRRSPARQVDLLVVLDRLWPSLDESQRERIREAVRASALDRVLTRQLGSRAAVRRARAALLVGTMKLEDASDLLALLTEDHDGDVRLVSIRGLAAVADRRAAEVMIEALASGHVEPERVIERLANRWAVATILAELASMSSTPAVRAALTRSLGIVGDPSAETVLRAMLRTGSMEERVGAARALGTAGTPAAAPDLETALTASEWPVRVQAARSLGLLEVEQAVPALATSLSDDAWWVRSAAAEALASLGEPGRLALRAAVAGPDRYARERAQEALTMHDLVGGA
jgi:HEAT repeat protein